MKDVIDRHRKALAALALGVLGWATQVVQSPRASISASEWIGLGTAAVVALGVRQIANRA